jgi:hypothetical protein
VKFGDGKSLRSAAMAGGIINPANLSRPGRLNEIVEKLYIGSSCESLRALFEGKSR